MGMTKEQKYTETMKRLGIYDPAFDDTIRQLATLEREQSRTRDEWKAPMEAVRDIKAARRKAKECGKTAEGTGDRECAEAWKETAEAWEKAGEIWKEAAETWENHPMADKLYAVILQQNKIIHQLRESLGLTPKALKRFRAEFGTPAEDEPDEKPKNALELLMEKRRAG